MRRLLLLLSLLMLHCKSAGAVAARLSTLHDRCRLAQRVNIHLKCNVCCLVVPQMCRPDTLCAF